MDPCFSGIEAPVLVQGKNAKPYQAGQDWNRPKQTQRLGQKAWKEIGWFLGHFKTPKGHFENN